MNMHVSSLSAMPLAFENVCVKLPKASQTTRRFPALSRASKAAAESHVSLLQSVTLAVPENAWMLLVGPSGSGKSSLLMLMGGLERASGGTIKCLGQDLTPMSEDALARFRRDHMGVVEVARRPGRWGMDIPHLGGGFFCDMTWHDVTLRDLT